MLHKQYTTGIKNYVINVRENNINVRRLYMNHDLKVTN